MQTKIKKTTTVRIQISLSGEDILDLLKSDNFDIGTCADVKIIVPGGGDYSNMSIDIDEENPILVSYEKVSIEED